MVFLQDLLSWDLLLIFFYCVLSVVVVVAAERKGYILKPLNRPPALSYVPFGTAGAPQRLAMHLSLEER